MANGTGTPGTKWFGKMLKYGTLVGVIGFGGYVLGNTGILGNPRDGTEAVRRVYEIDIDGDTTTDLRLEVIDKKERIYGIGAGPKFRIGDSADELTRNEALERIIGVYDAKNPKPTIAADTKWVEGQRIMADYDAKRTQSIEALRSRLSEFESGIKGAKK